MRTYRDGVSSRLVFVSLLSWWSLCGSAVYLRQDISDQRSLVTESDGGVDIGALGDDADGQPSAWPQDASRNGTGGGSEGIVHFLFLANDSIAHPEIWGQFFAAAPRDSWRVWVHCKHEALCASSRLFEEVPEAQLVPAVATEYCTDLVTGMAQLLRVSSAHGTPGVSEKFAFVGDTTLPVKPFAVVYGALMAHPEESDFCVHPSDSWRSADVNGTTFLLVKHSQWVVLGKRHAEDLLRRWVPVDHGNWQVPVKAGRLPEGGNSSILHWKFRGSWQSGVCTDEWAPLATLFGTLEAAPGPGESAEQILPGFGTLRTESAEAQGRCRTFVLPDSHRNFLGALAEPILRAAEGDPQQVRVRGHDGDPAKGTHPMSFVSAGSVTLNSLRASPFLFARKFPADSEIPFFGAIVLA